MKIEIYILLIFLLLSIGFGCDSKRSTEQNPVTNTVANDTSRNIPYPAQGILIDPDSLATPKTVPLLRKPKVVSARNNIFVAKPPTTIPFPYSLQIITPGKNGIPLPDTISMLQKVTTVRHPRPTAAGPLTMKPEAITDIQYLSVSQGLKNPFINAVMEDSRGNLWIQNGEYLSRYDGQHFIHYPFGDGIAMEGNFITSMIEDRRGNIWLGGNAGLNRYDGKRSTHYTFEGGRDILYITSMMEDKGGKLWFGTYRGMYCYDPLANSGQGIFIKYTTREGLINNSVKSILEDHRGGLWFGTRHGLSHYDGEHFTNYPIEACISNDDNTIISMIEDSHGVIWIGTDLGLIRFDPSENIGSGSYANININTGRVIGILEDDKGNIWVAGYTDGLFCLLRNESGIGNSYMRYTQNEGLSGNYFRNMIKDSHGNICISGQNGGMSRINIKNPIRYFNQVDGLKGNNVDCIFEDSRGFLWFGVTESVGAIKYDASGGGTFTNYGKEEGLDEGSITSIMEDRQGNIWMGSWAANSGNGASRLNLSKQYFQSKLPYSGKESFTYFNTESGLKERTVFSMFQDSRGNLWFGNDPGVTYFEPDYFGSGSGRFFHFPLEGRSFVGSGVDFLEDRNGDIWIGSGGGGGYKLDLNLSENKIEAPGPVVAKRSTETINTHDWTKGQTYTNFTTKDGLLKNQVTDIMEDGRGMIWFVTNNGLSRFDPERHQFYTYGHEDGLLSDNIRVMAEDQQKNLWILSQSGINVLVLNQKNLSDSSDRDDYQFFTFSAPDGFGTVDSGFKNLIVTRQNQLWWATGDGVASLDLNNFELPEDAPRINLNSLEIEQTYLDFSGFQDTDYQKSSGLTMQLSGTFDSVAAFNNYPLNLALPYDINHLTFQFSAIDWTSPHQLKYSYLMEGMDDTWSELSSETKADYRNLEPGDYIFKVKAIGAAKKWSKEFTYPFKVRPPWWLTWWAYTIYGMIFIFSVFLVDRLQRKRLLDKAHAAAREKELVQAHEIEKAYHELKTTQSQLIQSEKMASLGELTAGIAHEIQNPLNFVNNFSEVNSELIDELEEEADKGNLEDVKSIAKDIKENEQKIKHHGLRASGIVIGMLEHSRSSDGKKEPIDINALADEYLRLAYHGLRAKDKSFNADFKTELDETLPKINIISQDIGRVLLNLINNAFYAVDKKAIVAIETYKPTVTVTTNQTKSPSGDFGVEIQVKDNGEGIPVHLRDKIFQPFFTTKPTGSGTGLGLSLSYDIVKAHGGEIRVDSEKGEGTVFIIQLPLV